MADRITTDIDQEPEWWAAWFDADYSWDGLAELKPDGTPVHPWKGWVVVDKRYCARMGTHPTDAETQPATLQDYWRADPLDGWTLRDPAAMRAIHSRQSVPELAAGPDGRDWHIAHLPPASRDGETRSWKVDLEDARWDVLQRILQVRMDAGVETDIDELQARGAEPPPRAADADQRTQLQGTVLRDGTPQPATDDRVRHLRADRCVHLGAADYALSRWGRGVDFREAWFSKLAKFEGAEFQGRADFSHTVFAADLRASRIQFLGHIDFQRAHFWQFTDFNLSKFLGGTRFNGARFHKVAEFKKAQFSGASERSRTEFAKTEFDQRADFQEALFQVSLIFSDATLHKAVTFQRAHFSELIDFKGTRFKGAARFDSISLDGSAGFQKTVFEGEGRFYRARIGDSAGFQGAHFKKDAVFRGVTVVLEANFEGAVFEGTAFFESASFLAKLNLELGSAHALQAGLVQTAKNPDRSLNSRICEEVQKPGENSLELVLSTEAARKETGVFSGFDFRYVLCLGPAVFNGRGFDKEPDFTESRFFDRVEFHGASLHEAARFYETRFGIDFQKLPPVPWEGLIDEICTQRGMPHPPKGIDWENSAYAPSFDDQAFWGAVYGAWKAYLRNVYDADPTTFDQFQKDSQKRLGDPLTWVSWRASRFKHRKLPHADRHEAAYRRLKRIMRDLGSHIEEQRFFARELKARQKRQDLKRWERWSAGAYGLLADYGQSATQPLRWLVGIWVVFSLAYTLLAAGTGTLPAAPERPAPSLPGWVVDSSGTDRWLTESSRWLESTWIATEDLAVRYSGPVIFALEITVVPVANPVEFHAWSSALNDRPGWSTFFSFIRLLNRIASVLMLFLFVLALRRRFQIG